MDQVASHVILTPVSPLYSKQQRHLVISIHVAALYYSDLTKWTQLPVSTVDPKSTMGFPFIREIEGKWAVVCGAPYNALPAPS